MTPEDFYIGYETGVPAGARSRIAGAVTTLLVVAGLLAAAMALGQQPFANSTFAFGTTAAYEGRVTAAPYPTLDTGRARYLLTAPGKHGAEALVAGHHGQTVRLLGTLIAREGREMLQVEPGSVSEVTSPGGPEGPQGTAGPVDFGDRTLSGEIVDAKCYLGVMNPGEGTPHRDCAGVCIRGGIPPLLAVRSTAGNTVLVTLVDANDGPANDLAAPLAGRPVTVSGRLVQHGPPGQWRLRVTRIAPAPRR